MKYTTQLNSKLLFATVALGVLMISGFASSREEDGRTKTEPGKTQHLASADGVPEGLTASDWSSIRAAYQTHRYQAVQVEVGHRARNPQQQWSTEFDGKGFITRPEAGDWQWGLELKSYGFAGQKRVIGHRAEVTARGERVTYLHETGLREWFVNDQRGLEHGFTVEQRPAGGNEEKTRLEFDLAVRGSLHPEISTGGETLRFADPQGNTVLTYSGLKVWDAAGTSLPARFAAQPEGRVRLVVDERGARYPITVDPIAQLAYLKASNSDAGDSFGSAVAVSGDTVVVGAPFESSNATGVNGDETDNSALSAGAAYVFVRNGNIWSQQAYLKASNTDAGDRFGISVSISNDTLLIGADSESSNATGINGNQADNNAQHSGAAYVFVRNGDTWTQQAYLKASNTNSFDTFGWSAAVSDNTAVVGAVDEDSDATGVNGDEFNEQAGSSGAAYVFVRDGDTWTQQAYLKASNTDIADEFGFSVAISGTTVVVGAVYESSNATGVNGDETDDSLISAGAAYVFVRNDDTWTQQAYLKASNTVIGNFFGGSVAVSSDTVVIGAIGDPSSATGVNGDQNNNDAPISGAAYVFVRNGDTWSQQAYLKASNTDPGDEFGFSVAASGSTAIVGARLESSKAVGVNGDQTDNSAFGAGAAYVFVRNDTAATWSQQAYLKASNTNADDLFGTSVAVSGDTVVSGAIFESSKATGVNGDENNNSAAQAGAAYVFTLGPATLLNISSRLNVGTGDNVLIGGFIVTGSDPKKVILRAIGPSLPLGGATGVLADPVLELHEPDGTVITNDNWRDTQELESIDSTIPPTNDLESAIVATLDPGPYTAIVRGKNDGTGIGLVEVYDLDQAADSQLANISTRGFVETGDNVMIGGFILGDGIGSATVVVRGIGPSLAGAGVTNPLLDPTLELYDSNGTLTATNDNWMESPHKQAIIDSGLAPTNDKESALLADLVPGAYTAILRGSQMSTGVALIEVYNLQ
ncbi:hypothetical protein BH20VER3_BH20VER3_04510 [soil metagenome]